ncbi:RmlC-like cupin domain-containing protein [Truncatella angustata]|uniref:RmlC-like cupin domain-containing protein n=1 Tax=Truncatella angustata TaxID=152316 RepID=A0A9P8UMG2_9PEZI|nr:RmlC-like cupin domain-containing protein [Truncatella angustata]KAH6654851.1 RmlC-like cupin domain-containing protein [Truncatella angustata]
MLFRHLYTAIVVAQLAFPSWALVATPIDQRSAQEVVEQLQLVPNVEKGYYIQTFQDPVTIANRSLSTAIYYLLEGTAGQSIWHRLDAAEVWHFYAGAPLTLSLSHNDGAPVQKQVLGPDVFSDQSPQVVIPAGTWQSAHSLGSWTLVGTTVAPGFVEGGSELAEPGWAPAGNCSSSAAG